MKISALSIQKQETIHYEPSPTERRASTGRDKSFPVTRQIATYRFIPGDKTSRSDSIRGAGQDVALQLPSRDWPRHTEAFRTNRLVNSRRASAFQATMHVEPQPFERRDKSIHERLRPSDLPGPVKSRQNYGQAEIVPRRITPSVSGALKTIREERK